MQKAGLDVEFILDGDLIVWDECYANRWLPWNCTWVELPLAAYELNAGLLGRVQVFDVASSSPFGMYAATHYGKFSRVAQYPYLVWEPSDQDEIGAIAQTYLRHTLHEPQGLRFATNLSPERFQVFAAQYTGTAWNARLPATANLQNPFAFPLSNNNALVVFAWNASCSCVVASTWVYSSWFGAIKMSTPSHPVAGGARALKSLQSVTRVGNNNNTFLVSDSFGTSTLVSVSANNGTVLSGGAPFSSASGGRLFWATGAWVLQATASCRLQLVGGNNVSVCVVPLASPNSVLDASLAAVPESGLLVIGWADSSLSVTLGIYVSASGALVSKARIGAGRSVTVSYERSMLLVTATDSFCWNNEFNNKEMVHVCGLTATSCPGVLSYWLAPVANWGSALLKPTAWSFTACDATIAHGAFDNGSQGRSTTFWDNGAFRMLEVHVGATNATQYPLCGVATPYAGLVIDSFDVSQYMYF